MKNICKKCGAEMLEEFENIKGHLKIIWFCPDCDDIGQQQCRHKMFYPTDGSIPQCEICGKVAGRN
jgi:histidinol phosphatase-like enzyme